MARMSIKANSEDLDEMPDKMGPDHLDSNHPQTTIAVCYFKTANKNLIKVRLHN